MVDTFNDYNQFLYCFFYQALCVRVCVCLGLFNALHQPLDDVVWRLICFHRGRCLRRSSMKCVDCDKCLICLPFHGTMKKKDVYNINRHHQPIWLNIYKAHHFAKQSLHLLLLIFFVYVCVCGSFSSSVFCCFDCIRLSIQYIVLLVSNACKRIIFYVFV